MLEAGDVVTVEFPGAHALKRRPVVVVSTSAYHSVRPDVIVALLTSNISAANTQMDCLIHDWPLAGLNQTSAFRSYLYTPLQSKVNKIGRLSERDWIAVKTCLSQAIVG